MPPDKPRSLTHGELVPQVQAVLCHHLSETGNLREAAALVGTSISAIRARERRDPEFADAMAEAWQAFKDNVLIPTALRRAVEGVRRGVYYRGELARDENGNPVYEYHHSDGLLMRLLEVFDHRFRPHNVSEVKAQVGPAQFDNLTPDQRAKLEALLDSLSPPAAPEEAPRVGLPDAPG